MTKIIAYDLGSKPEKGSAFLLARRKQYQEGDIRVRLPYDNIYDISRRS